jgi:hypothetical protein
VKPNTPKSTNLPVVAAIVHDENTSEQLNSPSVIKVENFEVKMDSDEIKSRASSNDSDIRQVEVKFSTEDVGIIKHGVFRHIIEKDKVVDQKYVVVPSGYKCTEEWMTEVLEILDLRPPTLFFYIDGNFEFFELHDEYKKGAMLPIDFNLDPGDWKRMTSPEIKFQRDVIRDKTEQIVTALGDACTQAGAWIVLNSPSRWNKISTFFSSRVEQDNLVGIYNPELVRHQRGVFEQVFENAKKCAVSKGENVKWACEINHVGKGEEVDRYPNPYVKNTIICDEKTKDALLTVLKNYARKGTIAIRTWSQVFGQDAIE